MRAALGLLLLMLLQRLRHGAHGDEGARGGVARRSSSSSSRTAVKQCSSLSNRLEGCLGLVRRVPDPWWGRRRHFTATSSTPRGPGAPGALGTERRTSTSSEPACRRVTGEAQHLLEGLATLRGAWPQRMPAAARTLHPVPLAGAPATPSVVTHAAVAAWLGRQVVLVAERLARLVREAARKAPGRVQDRQWAVSAVARVGRHWKCSGMQVGVGMVRAGRGCEGRVHGVLQDVHTTATTRTSSSGRGGTGTRTSRS